MSQFREKGKKRLLSEITEKNIADLYRDGGYYYPSTHKPQPHLTFKDSFDKRMAKNSTKVLAQRIFGKPSIGQLARQFNVNKPQIKRILLEAGLIEKPKKEKIVSKKEAGMMQVIANGVKGSMTKVAEVLGMAEKAAGTI